MRSAGSAPRFAAIESSIALDAWSALGVAPPSDASAPGTGPAGCCAARGYRSFSLSAATASPASRSGSSCSTALR